LLKCRSLLTGTKLTCDSANGQCKPLNILKDRRGQYLEVIRAFKSFQTS
jgi:hypothetical protein